MKLQHLCSQGPISSGWAHAELAAAALNSYKMVHRNITQLAAI